MKINISKYYCKTTDPAFDEYVELAREQYGDECAKNLVRFKEKNNAEYINASGFLGKGGWAWSESFYPEQGLLPFTTQQHIKEQAMNDEIMEAVVALKGDLMNIPQEEREILNLDNKVSCYLKMDTGDSEYFISDLPTNARFSRFVTICTVEEFEESASKWKASQPKPPEVDHDVIPFDLKSGKHAVKMADGLFGIVLGKYVVYDDGYDTLDTVKDRIVEVVLLSVAPDDEYFYPQLGSGFTGIFEECENLHTVWKKKPIKTPQQLEVERLQKLLVDTQDELNKLTGSDTGGLND